MHNAPAVAYPVGRSYVQAWLLVGLLACDGLALTRWCVSVENVGRFQMLAWALTVLVAVAMLRTWWQAPLGQLVWDGNVWTLVLKTSSLQVHPERVLDLQSTLLLRLCGSDKPHLSWVWLERSARPARWLALRRAVHDRTSIKVQAGLDGGAVLERSP